MDLSDIPQDTLIARGAYSTIRSAHEDEKKVLQSLCGQMMALSSQILRQMQPDCGAADMTAVSGLLALCRNLVGLIDESTTTIDALAKQRAQLKPIAWSK